ncbi:MAG: DUF6188 family protein [Actinobacteria bacterium]|nr:DUF6188 family protein [Actinomycetota bacterium]
MWTNNRSSEVESFTDGVLILSIENIHFHTLRVEPKAHYEAWVYTFGNYILPCPPGGKLA